MRVSSLFILFIFLLSSVLSDVVVYDGTTGNLASGWQDFSWATHNLKDTSNHIAGHTYVFLIYFYYVFFVIPFYFSCKIVIMYEN